MRYLACARQPLLSDGSASTGGTLRRVRYLLRTVSQFVLEPTAAGLASGVGFEVGRAAAYSSGPLVDDIASGARVARRVCRSIGGGGGENEGALVGSAIGGAAEGEAGNFSISANLGTSAALEVHSE